MRTLHTVIVSNRPQREGAPIGHWAHEAAVRHGKFDARLVDLKEINLPFFDEGHPRFRNYVHQHTKDWSALVSQADAFVFVMPEYNSSMPAPLVNAIDFLFHEWAHKPCAFVSYGGAAGGARAVQMAKQLVTAVKMMPIPEGVQIPFFSKQIADGAFKALEAQDKAAAAMLDELHRWTDALAPLRGK